MTTKIKTQKNTLDNNFLSSDNRLYLLTQTIVILLLIIILKNGLLPALIAGLLSFYLVKITAPLYSKLGIVPVVGKSITLVSIALIVISMVVFGSLGLISFLHGESGGFIALLQKMADIVATARAQLPESMQEYIPANFIEMQAATAQWLREYAVNVSVVGKKISVSFVYILMGLIIGGMIAFSSKYDEIKTSSLVKSFIKRAELLVDSFGRIVSSQVKISLINTTLTGIFLAVILPLFGVHLPFTKIMISITFLVGLLPVIGNIISNTVIVLISLSVSHVVAFSSLAFLVIIHKLEYFLNAHIIGTKINSRAWEILIAMLFMESSFGIAGIVAAPIFYAYIKDELSARKII